MTESTVQNDSAARSLLPARSSREARGHRTPLGTWRWRCRSSGPAPAAGTRRRGRRRGCAGQTARAPRLGFVRMDQLRLVSWEGKEITIVLIIANSVVTVTEE